ncbi:MAG: AsmA family protein [Bacteroidetes bacterium]|nr:AsmA family protein [Bacteroidota bacterium]
MKKRTKIILVILLVLITTPVLVLFIVSKMHHQTVHDEFVHFVNSEFGEQIEFSDLSFSYLKKFPNAQIELKGITIKDDTAILSQIGRVEILLNPVQLIQRKVKLVKLLIVDATFHSVIDSLGHKPKILSGKDKKSDSIHTALLLDADKIILKRSSLYFANQIKGNRTCISIEEAHLKITSIDSILQFTGEMEGRLDTLISNNTVLFASIPVTGHNIKLIVNRYTGIKELKSGYLMAHDLKLIPRFMMKPHGTGQQMELHISGEDNFDAFLDLFEFHSGMDLKQTNTEAKLALSYNQKGFVNPFLRPYSELDFSITGALFEGEVLPYPLNVQKISGNYNNGEGHSPQTVELVIDTIHAQVNESYIHGRFQLNNLHDPLVDAHLVAMLDLEHLMKNTGNIQLRGSIDLDLKLKGKINEIRQFHLEGRQLASGKIDVHNLALMLNDQGYELELLNGSTILNNHILEITTLVGTFNKSAFHFEGLLENLDRLVIPNEEKLVGQFTLHFDDLDLTKIDAGKKDQKDQGFSIPPFSKLALDFLITGDNLVTGYGALKNINLDCRLQPEKLQVRNFGFDFEEGAVDGNGVISFSEAKIGTIELNRLEIDAFEGHSMLNGKVDLDSSGIKNIRLLGDIDIDHLEIEKIINTFHLGPKESKIKKPIKYPDEIDIAIGINSRTMKYKDVELENTRFDLRATEAEIEIRDFKTDLPFGNLELYITIQNFRNKNIQYAGTADLIIDSLSINDLLDLEALGIPDLDQKNQSHENKVRHDWPAIRDLSLTIQAGHLSYNNATIHNLDLKFDFKNDILNLENLDFDFAGGKTKIYGHLIPDHDDTRTGYLYSNTKEIDLTQFFQAFNNFGQDVFTEHNTSGNLSWTSHFYFRLNKNLVPVKSDNAWIFNARIHHAEFEKVKPIEETLFFVGHKSKDNMIVSQMNINAVLFQNKIYFRDVFMNDNIANLGVFGEVDLDQRDMNLDIEVSLSDLFFRSKKKRLIQTIDGEANMENDSRIYLKMLGPLSDGKVSLGSKREFKKNQENLMQVINASSNYFKQKQAIQ